MENNRNYFVAIALSVLILVGWQFLYMGPKMEAQRQAEIALQKQQADAAARTPAASGNAAATVGPDAAIPGANPAAVSTGRDETLATTPRVTIDTPALSGSINLAGARFDDLKLKDYTETVDPKSPIISLFNPAGLKDGYFAELGYVGTDAAGSVPGPATLWTVSGNSTLTDKTPVTLTYTNDKGLTFTRTISVDDHYMFTISDSVRNAGTADVSLSSYGRVARNNKPTTPSVYVLHEGFIGVIGENGLEEVKYKDTESAPVEYKTATGGWIGITDKYWAAAIVPPRQKATRAAFRILPLMCRFIRQISRLRR